MNTARFCGNQTEIYFVPVFIPIAQIVEFLTIIVNWLSCTQRYCVLCVCVVNSSVITGICDYHVIVFVYESQNLVIFIST